MHILRKEETPLSLSQPEKFTHLVNGAKLQEKSCSARASRTLGRIRMSASSTDKGLLTPDNCAVVFIDHQPQMLFGVASMDRRGLLNNVLVLAKAAKIFGVPVILTAIKSKGCAGSITPELLELFSDLTPIERSSMNAWDCREFMAAVKKTGRKNLVLAALWSEVCLAMPALQALTDGYAIYAVEDASGGANPVAHAAAIRRIEQAGAVSVTALQVLLEFQRDWVRNEHYDEVMAVVRTHCGAYGQSVEGAATMIPKAPASRRQKKTSNSEAQNT
jgi:nicotinamidase-related amidase